jgi:hypothetical protein
MDPSNWQFHDGGAEIHPLGPQAGPTVTDGHADAVGFTVPKVFAVLLAFVFEVRKLEGLIHHLLQTDHVGIQLLGGDGLTVLPDHVDPPELDRVQA